MSEPSAPGDAQLLSALFSSSSDCVKLLDAEGRLQEMNPCGLNLMEINDFSALRNRPWAELWPEEDRAKIIEAVQRARQGASSSFSAFCPTAQGNPRWWEVSVQPIRDGRGEVVRIFSVSRDCTEARRFEQALRDQVRDKEAALLTLIETLEAERRQLQSARAQIAHSERLRLLGQFVGSVVHDVNNVLAAMSGAARLIRRKTSDEKTLEVLSHVDQAVARGLRLMRRLLDFARAGGAEPELLDLAAALDGDVELMRHMIGPEVVLEIRCEEGLWPVLAAPDQVQSVLFNLLGNARDALGGRGRVEISARNRRSLERLRGLPAGDYVEIAVADNGPGMPAEVVARLGEPFFTTKDKGKGTGLGVLSAFELAKACAGRVEIDSAPGMGARIALHLPRAGAAGELIATPDSEVDPALHGEATLLIVDNEPALLSHLTALAASVGYRALAARDAATALAYLASDLPIDLIISDLHLGDASGLDIARASRAAQPDRPVIFISGTFGMGVPVGEVLLRKPVDEKQLSRVVLEKLGRLPASHLTGAALRASERVRERLRHDRLRDLFDLWRAEAARYGRLPPWAALASRLGAGAEICYLVEVRVVEGAPDFRFVQTGAALRARLGRDLSEAPAEPGDDEILGSLTQAFARARRGVAYYDYARMALDPRRASLFERLLLPLSDDGVTVTHILGVVIIEDVAV